MELPQSYVIIIVVLGVVILGLRLRDRTTVYRIPGVLEDIVVDSSTTPKTHLIDSTDECRIDYNDINWMELVASGHFGEVHKARWHSTLVAVKKLFNRQKIDGELLRQFEKETNLMRKLRHPNIILFMGAIMDPQNLGIVTEYMGKGSLHDVLHSKSEVLRWDLIISMAMDGARGMQYLHHFKPPIIHRDLKSRNLLVDDQYNIKVCDFGLSKFKSDDKTTNFIVGTVQWTAPEILRDEGYNEKADVYSFGIVMWELISRDSPFKNLNHLEIAIAVAYDTPPKRPTPVKCPERYEKLMAHCWSPDATERPNFDYVLSELKEILVECHAYEENNGLEDDQNSSIHTAGNSKNEALTDKPDILSGVAFPSISFPGDNNKYSDQHDSDKNYSSFQTLTPRQSNSPRSKSGASTPRTLLEEQRENKVILGSRVSYEEESVHSIPTEQPQPLVSEKPKNIWKIAVSELQILNQVGAGSFGVVSKALWRDTEVAVKFLTNQTLGAKQLEEFESEIALMCELRHPNVVLFMGACLEAPSVCLVTEFMPKGNLYDVLHTESLVLDWLRILSMAIGAARGMNYLHCSNPIILHRDLKSSNLLVDENWIVKVSDFGMSRFKVDDCTMTQVGTPKWTAPEILRGDRYSEKVDVYSYGIILWELFTREEPYPNLNAMKMAMDMIKHKIRPVIPPNCPPLYSSLMQECWSEDSDSRPPFSLVIHRLKNIETNALSLKQKGLDSNNAQSGLPLIRSSSLGSIKGKKGSRKEIDSPKSQPRSLSGSRRNSHTGKPTHSPRIRADSAEHISNDTTSQMTEHSASVS